LAQELQKTRMSTATNRPATDTYFFLASAGGFIVIALTANFPGHLMNLLPAAIVLIYALYIRSEIMSCPDRSLAEHHADSIYFLGFLFTLASLITLFMQMARPGATDSDTVVRSVLVYIGISISTSIAGVLFRSIVRGHYLLKFPERTVDSIEAFLTERAVTTNALLEKEQAYLQALDRYIAATETFSHNLSQSQALLTPHVEAMAGVLNTQTAGLNTFHQLADRFLETAALLEHRAAGIPWNIVTQEMNHFHRGVEELNGVLDSLITVLEHKVERIQ